MNVRPSDLEFEPTVRHAFNFLCSKLGFTCSESTPTAVLYTSANAWVEITLDPRSYEVSVELRQTAGNRSFPLHRIIELTSPTDAEQWRLVQISTRARVKEFIPKLAGLLETYGRLALAGDSKTF